MSTEKIMEQPVNARLLEALIQCRDRFAFYVEHHRAKGDSVRADDNAQFLKLADEAISAAEAQQERLLQDMHDAGREVDRVMAEPQPDADGPWKSAVIDQLVIAHILTAEHESDPLKAIQDLLAYNSDIAVDPRVSGAAAKLVERTKEACAKDCMDEARKWPYPSHGNAAASMCAKMIFDMRQK